MVNTVWVNAGHARGLHPLGPLPYHRIFSKFFGNIIFKPASYEDLPQIKKELKNSLVLLLVNGLFIGVVNVVLKKPENPVFVITLLPLGSLCLATPIYVTMWIAFIGFNKKRKK